MRHWVGPRTDADSIELSDGWWKPLSDEHRRVAAALLRVAPLDRTPIPLSQAELGTMSNTSRKQVTAALQRFAAAGWLTKGYRTIIVLDDMQLRRFVESGET